MRAPRNTQDREDAFVSPAARTTIAIAVLAGFFALLVAVAAPGIAAAFALGGLATIGGARARTLFRRVDAVCIPGTDVCLRSTAA